jgi:cobalt-zinc-cadmium resistance protein CzcA
VLLEDGLINSDVNDYKITLSQEIAFPWVYVKQAEVQKQQTRLLETDRNIKLSNFVEDVKRAYMSWRMNSERLRILQKQDTIFKNFLSASKQFYETGNINRMAWLLAGSRATRVECNLKEAAIETGMSEKELRTILCSVEQFQVSPGMPEKLVPPIATSVNPNQISNIQWLSHNYHLQELKVGKENWSAAPSLNFGWFTQSIDQLGNYTGWQYGISIPVWFWVPAGRIQSAKISRTIALNEYEWGKKSFANSLEQLQLSLEKQKINLDYYEKSALSQAMALIETAEKSYQTGEIDYFEYIISMGEAFSIQLEYIRELEKYNNVVIDMTNLIAD